MGSTSRPDTLTQSVLAITRKVTLATEGQTIHLSRLILGRVCPVRVQGAYDLAMAQKQPPEAPAEDDVRIFEHRTLDGDVGHSWDVFFGRSSMPMHSTREQTARRAAQQHARGHQVAVWFIIKDHPKSRELLFDHRKAVAHRS